MVEVFNIVKVILLFNIKSLIETLVVHTMDNKQKLNRTMVV